MSGTILRLAPFKAGRAAEITGRSTDNQRNDARLGLEYAFRDYGSGQRSFNVYGLARMLGVQALVPKGYSPKTAFEFAGEMAGPVAHWALTRPGAVRGDPTEYHRIYCPQGYEHDRAYIDENDKVVEVSRYYIIWSDESTSFVDSLDDAFGKNTAMYATAAVVLSVHAVGEELAARAGKGALGWIETEEEARSLDRLLKGRHDD